MLGSSETSRLGFMEGCSMKVIEGVPLDSTTGVVLGCRTFRFVGITEILALLGTRDKKTVGNTEGKIEGKVLDDGTGLVLPEIPGIILFGFDVVGVGTGPVVGGTKVEGFGFRVVKIGC
jgi:hypothetical protein